MKKTLIKLISYKEEFLDNHDVDFRFNDGPKYVGPSLKPEGTFDEDIWGDNKQHAYN